MSCHAPGRDRVPGAGGVGTRQRSAVQVTVAIAGQPNVGKSTIFNALTGLHQHVGNWPGKTIEQRTGEIQHDGLSLGIVDLPGTYSLGASSPEEQVARDFILHEAPGVVLLVADASALERNLYLLAELLALPAPVVLALNMMDVAKQQGVQINRAVLEAALGIPVVMTVARRGEGIPALLDAVSRAARIPNACRPTGPLMGQAQQQAIGEIRILLDGQVPSPYPPDWVALKLLEGDREVLEHAPRWLLPDTWSSIRGRLEQHEGGMLDVASSRYAWIGEVTQQAVSRPATNTQSLTDRLDRIALHPVLGVGLLTVILGFIYWLTFTVAGPVQEWLEVSVTGAVGDWIRADLEFLPEWMVGLLADGLLGGVGTVLTFVPILVVFFAALGLLEDTGYLTRAAYVMDRSMSAMGLHGKSVLTLVLGFGCNVPAIMGTRVLESRSSRLLTIVLAPFVPCAARLTVLAFLVPIFFAAWAPVVAVGLVILNMLVLGVLGVVLSRLLFRGEQPSLILELPLYHQPSVRTISLFVWHNVKEFLYKAGSLIVTISVIVWALSTFPGPDIEDSVLGMFGHLIAPVGQVMGMDWRMLVALLGSFPAKENSIAILGILYGAGEESETLATALASEVTAATALGFLVVQMLFIPCMATVATIHRETSSLRWTVLSVVLSLSVSLAIGMVAYQTAVLVGLGSV